MSIITPGTTTWTDAADLANLAITLANALGIVLADDTAAEAGAKIGTALDAALGSTDWRTGVGSGTAVRAATLSGDSGEITTWVDAVLAYAENPGTAPANGIPGVDGAQAPKWWIVGTDLAPVTSPSLGGTPTAPTAAVSANSTQIATTAFVQSVAATLSASSIGWKQPVRAATTANGTLASAYENGDTLDGVTLATGDRILLKDQTTGAENGIYVVNASGAPTRAGDADSGAEMLGAAVFVNEGTANADSIWICTTNDPITVGSTSLAFAKIVVGVNPQLTTIELGAASDTTLSRVSAGVIAVEGKTIYGTGTTQALAQTSLGLGTGDSPQFTAVNIGAATDTTLARASAGRITVEGVAVPLQTDIVGRAEMPVPSNAMTPRTTNGPATGTFETSTNKHTVDHLAFDASTIEYAQFKLTVPKRWDRGTITAVFKWSHASTTTNFGVVWGIQGVALSDGDARDAAFGTAVTVTDTGGTTDTPYTSPETAAVTIAGTPAAGDLIVFQVYRNATDGSDTLAIDARLEEVVVYFTTSAATDA